MKYASSGAVLAATSKNTGAKVEFVKVGNVLATVYQTWLGANFSGILSDEKALTVWLNGIFGDRITVYAGEFVVKTNIGFVIYDEVTFYKNFTVN